ncbi:hypothetical protein pb186bvf_012115 [Paramecium bursaria]
MNIQKQFLYLIESQHRNYSKIHIIFFKLNLFQNKNSKLILIIYIYQLYKSFSSLMGNSKAKHSEKGQILVQTQRELYFINEMIVGQVFLNVTQPGFPAGIVKLRFIGKERAHKVEYYYTGKNVQRVDYDLNNKFLDTGLELKNFGNELPITQEVYPFQLPLNLYSTSFNANMKDDHYAYIKYYITVQVVPNIKEGEKKQKMKEVIKYKLPIIIAKPYYPLERPFSQDFRQDIQFCCCCKKGFAILSLKTPMQDFMTGDTVKLQMFLDLTRSPKDIIEMEITFNAVIKVVFQMLGTAVRFFDLTYNYQQIQGVKAGQSRAYDLQVPITQVSDSEQYKRVDIQSSTQTVNIIYRHFIKIKPKFSGCNCCFNWDVELPITVVRPSQQAFEVIKQNPELYVVPISPPQDIIWHPAVQHQQSLNVSQNQGGEKQPLIEMNEYSNKEYNQYHAYNQNYQPIGSVHPENK